MKKVKLFFMSLIMIFGISSCVINEPILNTDDENSSLVEEIQNLEEELQDIKDILSDLLDLLNEQQSTIEDLLGIIDDLESLEITILEIESTIQNIINLIIELTDEGSANNDLILELYDLLEELNRKIVEIQLNDFLSQNDFSEEYILFFKNKTRPLINAGMSEQEVIEEFNKMYTVSAVTAENDDLSTISLLTVSGPTAQEQDKIILKIYYHNDLLVFEEIFDKQNIYDFVFDAPHYGKYTLIGQSQYQNLIIENKYEFGITSSRYEFTLLNGTMPVLMYAADMIANLPVTSPTYITLQRPTTYNWGELPENVSRFPKIITRAMDYRYDGVYYLAEWIYELHKLDISSTFELNVVDNYTGLAIVAFDKYKIPENLYTINIWTDGEPFTTRILNTYDSKNKLDTVINYVNNLRQAAFGVTLEEIDYGYVSSKHHYSAFAYAQTLENANYFVTGLSGITVTDSYILDKIDSVLTVTPVANLFDNIRDSGTMNEFEYLLGTRWGESEEEGLSHHFDSEKGKYLLIIGTSTAGENQNATNKYYTFNQNIDLVADLYGSEYEILYKGHPAYPSSQERKDFFDTKGVVELRHTIPVEIMMLIYPNVYIGGYRSTTFVSALPGQTLFFFGTEQFIRANATFNNLFENSDLFDDTVFLFDPSM